MKLTIKNNLLQNSVRARLKLILQEIFPSLHTLQHSALPSSKPTLTLPSVLGVQATAAAYLLIKFHESN